MKNVLAMFVFTFITYIFILCGLKYLYGEIPEYGKTIIGVIYGFCVGFSFPKIHKD